MRAVVYVTLFASGVAIATVVQLSVRAWWQRRHADDDERLRP